MFKFFQDCMKITSLVFVTLVFILQRNQKQQKKSVNTIKLEREYILELRIKNRRHAFSGCGIWIMYENYAPQTTYIT